MLVQQTQYTIETLINRIRSGRLALPDFQRDFVWSPIKVADLLESIAREWPIGSLLLLNGPQPFAFRAIDSAPVLVDPELDLYVLDGQQRVTAVYHAIQNVSQFVYYVDFANSSDDAEEVILWDRRARFERRFPTLESRAAAGIALVNDFWENQRFHEWLDHIEHAQRRNEFVGFRERRLGGLQSKVYKLLATELEQGIELEALAKIFETLNKTGVRLNAFDLLVAKLYPPPTSFNLRESWESAKRESALLSKFDPDGLELIKLIALLVRSREGKNASRGVRQGDVLALAPQYVAQYWEEAIRLYSAALAQMQEFGVNNSNLVPSWSMVLGLAGCLEFGFQARAREWWTSRLSNQTFGQAANTRIVAEFDNLSQGNFEATLPHDLSELLSLPARPNGLLLRGLAALVIEQRCPDPITGADLSDSPKVEWFELSMTGQLLKLSQATDLSQTVFVSTTGLRHFDLRTSLVETAHGPEGLARQGFDLGTMRRTGNFLGAVFA